jgi:predicted RNase H-like HicB family nuclease
MTTLSAVVVKEEDAYVARCPEVGTVGQGESVEEAVKNLTEATELFLEEFPRKDFVRSILTTFEVSGPAAA